MSRGEREREKVFLDEDVAVCARLSVRVFRVRRKEEESLYDPGIVLFGREFFVS